MWQALKNVSYCDVTFLVR